ncbi:hypothetical protein EVAR_75850_1 [Eumeta japonica]|uniref:Uncharacterized protein n=1 Tax=Eumeta variegata TaxID=151549 RepID=A0A4C1TD61_EUMVA|nr:hypothetical protein EVAR_75850_1 [Eumeta japonica]
MLAELRASTVWKATHKTGKNNVAWPGVHERALWDGCVETTKGPAPRRARAGLQPQRVDSPDELPDSIRPGKSRPLLLVTSN